VEWRASPRRYVAASPWLAAALGRDTARVLPTRNIEELSAGTVRRRIPIRPTVHSRHDQRPFLRRHHARYSLRPTPVVEAVHPVHFHKRLAHQELPADSIQHIHQPIAVGPEHDLAKLALSGFVGPL